MKNSFLLCVFALSCLVSKAQQTISNGPRPEKSTYLGVSSGVNGVAGLIGIRFDSKLSEHVMLGAGIGLGSWGSKMTVIGSYLTKSNWNPFASFSRASGGDNVNIEFKTVENGVEQQSSFILNLYAVNTLNLGIEKQWITKKSNRFALNMGYSFSLSDGVHYKLVRERSGTFDEDDRKFMNFVSPGGIIIAFSYQLGL